MDQYFLGAPVIGEDKMPDAALDPFRGPIHPAGTYPINCNVLIDGQVRVNTYYSRKLDCEFCPQPRLTGDAMTQLIGHANISREAHGVRLLKRDNEVMRSAVAKAHDMHLRGYFDHQDPDGKFAYYTEIIAKCPTAYGAFYGWACSESHHSAMVDGRFSRVGVGHAGEYWVMQFSR